MEGREVSDVLIASRTVMVRHRVYMVCLSPADL